MGLVAVSRTLAAEVDGLAFAEPVTHVYNPLVYARAPHEAYLERYGRSRKRALLLGMNPGPFGMAQTGVPFGDVPSVRDWLGIEAAVSRPPSEHPKRPISGFGCARREVSGSRLWGWAQEFGPPEAFFRTYFVWNYCPLAFVEQSGRNRTPDKLAADERAPLFAACDRALSRVVEALEPEAVVGVGAFATERATAALGAGLPVFSVLHPSPASPLANKGWAESVRAKLESYGLPTS